MNTTNKARTNQNDEKATFRFCFVFRYFCGITCVYNTIQIRICLVVAWSISIHVYCNSWVGRYCSSKRTCVCPPHHTTPHHTARPQKTKQTNLTEYASTTYVTQPPSFISCNDKFSSKFLLAFSFRFDRFHSYYIY